MNEVKRYKAVINDKPYKPYAYCEESSDGIYVRLEDYTALQEQLTATTNSLTNAQEALKSAGIEADTVQAGVMELKAQGDALAAENAVIRAAIPEERFIDIMDEKMDDVSLAEDIGYNTAVKEMQRDIKTPATEAYLNAVRAEGADAAAAKIRKAIPAFKDIHCGAVKECADIAEMVAAQFTTGNAGKDGV